MLYSYTRYVLNSLFMPESSSVIPHEVHSSYGTIVLDHLAAHGAGLTGSQVAVVTLLQVDADPPWCSRSSLTYSFAACGNARTAS